MNLPAQLNQEFLLKVTTDTMQPTITQGDYISGNVCNRFMGDGVYIIGKYFTLCRLQQLLDGSFNILFDSPHYDCESNVPSESIVIHAKVEYSYCRNDVSGVAKRINKQKQVDEPEFQVVDSLE